MGLTKTQRAVWEKARSLGGGDQAVMLTDPICSYLVARIACDLGLQGEIPQCPSSVPSFFSKKDFRSLVVEGMDALGAFERLLELDKNADMYFSCLAALHKARLKYALILETQPIPTLEQVGPRGLLQYGTLSPSALGGLLFWRKWFFDIDNRAGQETGYLFEPVIANALGGTPATSQKSPVRRHGDPTKGRQVDCLLGNRAYEFKLRVTIAASGQGRWREELDFPIDCRESAYTPILVVLDSTANPKLDELERAFRDSGGEVFKGDEAWAHLDTVAGPTMSRFLDQYVRGPLDSLISEVPSSLPRLVATMSDDSIDIEIGADVLHILRRPGIPGDDAHDAAPDDADDTIPG